MREGEWPDGAVAGGVGVEEGEAEGAPHLHHAALAARDQVLAVARQEHALRRGRDEVRALAVCYINWLWVFDD